jgi:hypothetical protein
LTARHAKAAARSFAIGTFRMWGDVRLESAICR